jgi:hypothetical protein
VNTENRQVVGPPPQVRVAGALVAVQGLIGVGTAISFVVLAMSAGPVGGAVLGGAGYFLVMGAALLAVGIGLLTGRRWARTPAIVAQLLLLPVVYSLLGGSHQLVLGILAGAFVLTTFLLLISERSGRWWRGVDEPDATA